MLGAFYLLLILLFITLTVLTVKFYLQAKYGSPPQRNETPNAKREACERNEPSRVYFVRQPSANKAEHPKLQQVSSKNLFVLEQVDRTQNPSSK